MSYLPTLLVLERIAGEDLLDQRLETVIVRFKRGEDLPQGRLVVVLELAAEGVGEHLRRGLPDQVVVTLLEQGALQAGRAVERGAARQGAGGCDRRVGVPVEALLREHL